MKYFTVSSDIWVNRKNIILIGDFNSDLTDDEPVQESQYFPRRLRRILNHFVLNNVIKEPTRIGQTSKTIIDLIVISEALTDKVAKCGTFEPAISDHKLVYCVLKIKSDHTKPLYKCIKLKTFDKVSFQNSLEKALWWVSNVFDDIDDVTYFWETMYKDIVNVFIKTRKAKVKSHTLPWINRDIKKLMNQRYKALQMWQRNRNNIGLKYAYTKLRNDVTKALRLAVADYWKEQFENATTAKEFWQTINKLTKKSKSTNIAALDDGIGNLVTLASDKAELLNTFFADVGKDLAQSFQEQISDQDNSYIPKVTPISGQLKIDENYLIKQVKTLNATKST